MLTLTQLEYIVAVERAGNFHKAAKSVHVSQPSLSMLIKKLEDDLGLIIFDRKSQPVTPTPMGKRVLEQARVVLNQAGLVRELVDQEKQRVDGELRLAVIPTLAPYLLPLFLTELRQRHPQLQLLIEEMRTDDIIVALQNNQIDVGLLATPLLVETLIEKPLFYEPFLVYAHPESSLATLSQVEDKDLKDEDLLLLAEGHCMRAQMLKVCSKQRRGSGTTNKSLSFASGSIETLCHLVESGQGYTVIPQLVTTWRRGARGRIIPFAEPRPSREVSLVVHHSFVRHTMLAALADTITSQLPLDLRTPANKTKTIKFR